MKITKKITTVENVEFEISIPFYSTQDSYYYCILSENSVVQVWAKYNEMCSVSARDNTSSVFDDAANATPCTETEFKEQLSKAISLIAINTVMLISVYELPEPEDFETVPDDNSVDVNTPELKRDNDLITS